MVHFPDRVPRPGARTALRSEDSFERFAADCSVRVTVESLSAAPRDVLNPPADADQYYLVTLHGPLADAPGARLIFIAPLADPEPPGIRDALWWLASEAWAVDQAGESLQAWAAMADFDPADAATARMFSIQLEQRDRLKATLPRPAYERLLALYRAELTGEGNEPSR